VKHQFLYFNTHIHYTVQGNGTAIVLLHGFGEDSSIWDQQVAHLSKKYRVIVPDIPGSGGSDLLQGLSQAVSIDDYAVCIQALLQHEQVTSCYLFGHSMGGYIALAYAASYPNFLKGWGLIHSTAYADSAEKKQNRQRGIEMMEEYGAGAFLKTTIPNLFSAGYKQAYAEKIQELIDAGQHFTKEACQQYYTAMMNRPDRTDVLKNSKQPVLLVAGTEDVAAPLNDVLEQAKLPAISYIHVLDGVGHMGMWEAPQQLNEYIDGFVSQLAAIDAT